MFLPMNLWELNPDVSIQQTKFHSLTIGSVWKWNNFGGRYEWGRLAHQWTPMSYLFILVSMPLYNSFPCGAELTHVTCLGLGDISKCDMNRDWKSATALGLPFASGKFSPLCKKHLCQRVKEHMEKCPNHLWCPGTNAWEFSWHYEKQRGIVLGELSQNHQPITRWTHNYCCF
jgi:hypothetical protein